MKREKNRVQDRDCQQSGPGPTVIKNPAGCCAATHGDGRQQQGPVTVRASGPRATQPPRQGTRRMHRGEGGRLRPLPSGCVIG